MLANLEELNRAAEIVYQHMLPTPQYRWPLLNQRLGVELWLKHENHTPLGAFKVRGGLVYFATAAEAISTKAGVICATRGNHGQSVAFAAGHHNIPCTVVVPHGNSREKNSSVVALGAELIEHGSEFQDALEYAAEKAAQENLHMVPSFEPNLVAGVATYSLELFRAVKELDTLYVPIGLGSGICGAITARDALGLKTEIVGVVSQGALAYSKSFAQRKTIESPVTTIIADGMACRKPNENALSHILDGVARVVEVSDEQVETAMRDIYECTHNLAEGAGAAAVAAVTVDAPNLNGKTVAAILCGGNVDREVFARVIG